MNYIKMYNSKISALIAQKENLKRDLEILEIDEEDYYYGLKEIEKQINDYKESLEMYKKIQ